MNVSFLSLAHSFQPIYFLLFNHPIRSSFRIHMDNSFGSFFSSVLSFSFQFSIQFSELETIHFLSFFLFCICGLWLWKNFKVTFFVDTKRVFLWCLDCIVSRATNSRCRCRCRIFHIHIFIVSFSSEKDRDRLCHMWNVEKQKNCWTENEILLVLIVQFISRYPCS